MPRSILPLSLALLLWLLVSAPVAAHSDEWLAQRPSPHGGQVRMTGPYHLELLVEKDGLRVYVTDHGDQSIDTAGWTAEATILAAGAKTQLELTPSGANSLRGVGAAAADPERRIVVVVHPKTGESHSARFVPSVPAPAAASAP